tara:strand:- start:39 stop:419 length:381 start_codon:yes stop_codon:yes gene_type:complete
MNVSDSFEYLQVTCDQLSENKIFIGFAMILVNVGARFIIEELSDDHRDIVKSDLFRKIVIFASVFMATRDIIVALIVTIVFLILINEVLRSPDEETKQDDSKKGGSFVKQQLDKEIDKLKIIKDSI